MIYDKIKNNLTSPFKIYRSKDDKVRTLVLYIAFLVFLLLIPVLIDLVSTKGLDPGTRQMLKSELRQDLDIDCTIDGKLICDDKSIVNVAEFDSFDVVIDPGDNYVPSGYTTKLVFKEEKLSILFAQSEVKTYSYSELPAEWRGLEFDVDDPDFWDSLFDGIDELLMSYRSVWVISTILAYTFIFTLMILFEALLDTFIIKLFKYGRLSFKETITIVIYSMTSYVIIRVILDLYDIKATGFFLSLLQMIPLIYALLALRNAYRE